MTTSVKKTRFRILPALSAALATALLSPAQLPDSRDLTQVTLEELMNLKITSVSKKEEKISKTGAAIYVITQEDIHRSGATNIPDLLRMAPGVDVQQIDANNWAISIRGFNTRYSNKVLVLVDGRTVYTPSFSGVFWDQIDMPLENIDRIEVIRGPGASVWGANAVNGVISIFTKSSKATKGAMVSAAGGSQLRALGTLQYRGDAGNASYRVFANYFDLGNSAMPGGSRAEDHWMRMHGGFRSDWDLSHSDSLMVQGDLFANEESQTLSNNYIPTPFDRHYNQALDTAGGDVLARWTHTLRDGSETSLQTYYDTHRRWDQGVPDILHTFDLDFQHQFALGDRQDFIWGIGYRTSETGLSPGYAIAFTPPFQTISLFSGFVQDQIRVSDSLWLTVGARLEHNAYTGFEFEPTARLVWNRPGSRHTLWAAASKANRQPARSDTAVNSRIEEFPLGPSTVEVLRVRGNPRLKDEEVRDFELGYRADLSKHLSLDLATFFSLYRNLDSLEAQSPTITPGTVTVINLPLLYANGAHATDYGGEIAMNWQPGSRWRVTGAYSYLQPIFQQAPGDLNTYTLSTDFPRNLVSVRSLWNLSRRVEFDQSFYYTAQLPGSAIPGHPRLDLRLARKFGESAEISVVGQNLLQPRAMEYGNAYAIIGTEAVRSVYGRIVFRF